MGFKSIMILSICVPIFGTQCFLTSCLESIKKAIKTCIDGISSFYNALEDSSKASMYPLLSLFEEHKDKCKNAFLFELILVDDGSDKRCDKKLLYKIYKSYKKEFEKDYFTQLSLIEHTRNLGLLEARRSAVMASSGERIMFVDSDDEIMPNSILHLLCNAKIYNASILQGSASIGKDTDDASLERQGYKKDKIDKLEKKIKNVFIGAIDRGDSNEIMRGFLIEKNHNGFLWAKIFLADVCKKAFMEIPHSFCVMGEDFLIYFFILTFAHLYVGIKNEVYEYHFMRGVSSNQEIDSLQRWEASCTAGSVFAIIFDYLEEHPLEADMVDAINSFCSSHALSNVKHLRRVSPKIKDEAKKIMSLYWDHDMIESAEAYYQNNL